MAITRLISYDPDTKKYCKAIYDESEETVTLVNGQDVAAIIEDNKIARCLPPVRTKNKDGIEVRHVARIAPDILQHLMKTGIWWDIEARKRWLNDSDNQDWRRDDSTI